MKKLLLALLLLLAVPALAAERPDVVEVISITGEIGEGTASMITDKVKEISENKRVKAVLLELDTPGGGVLASSVIYEELSKLKVPVVAFCQNLCASGGMYVAMAPSVKFIGVRTSTISGSIGVIMTTTRYNRLLDFLKIDNETFKSGLLKDSGNPTREITEADRAYYQSLNAEFAAAFYELIRKARGDKIKDWDAVKSARIFIGASGVKVGLVDGVVSRDEAIDKAKALSGSALIFTRDEIKKMSKDAESGRDMTDHAPRPQALTPYEKLADVASAAIAKWQSAPTVRFSYILPYLFH